MSESSVENLEKDLGPCLIMRGGSHPFGNSRVTQSSMLQTENIPE